MVKSVQEKLAGSLTAEDVGLLPYLPYLLQDFWELGSEPALMADTLGPYVSGDAYVLDLACGKGAVSVAIAKRFGLKVKAYDLIADFVDFAKDKAKEHDVSHLCDFEVGDINETISTAKDYDAVILGAVGDVLGNPSQTLDKLLRTIKQGGYILIDECFLKDGKSQDDIGYDNYEYLTKNQWEELFEDKGLELVRAVYVEGIESENIDGVAGIEYITKRANELIEKHPDKREMFEAYVKN